MKRWDILFSLRGSGGGNGLRLQVMVFCCRGLQSRDRGGERERETGKVKVKAGILTEAAGLHFSSYLTCRAI